MERPNNNESRWWEGALCAQTDPPLFHPEPGGGAIPDTRAAKKVCANCGVSDACLEDALRTGDNEFGIRGGLTPSQRRRLLESRGLPTSEEGTASS